MEVNPSDHRDVPLWLVAGAGGVGVGIAATVIGIKFRNSKRNRSCALPCLLSLIDALQENFEKWRLEVEAEKWNDFVEGLRRRLVAVKKELETIQDASELDKCLGGVVKVIDEQLVEHLRREQGVLSVLKSFLPRPGQTWHDVLQLKSEDEQLLYIDLQRNIVAFVKLLVISIDELSSDLLQSLVSDAARGEEEPEETPPQAYKIVKVMFATDREVTADAQYVGKMSRLVEQNPVPLQYGWAEVGIPVAREVGTSNAPAKRSCEADPAKHIVIFSVGTELRGNLQRFLKTVDEELAGHDLLLYIHGYNTSHVKAVKQAAQLKNDLNFQGTILLFSWSSTGTLGGYRNDEQNIKAAADSLHKLLKSITNKVHAPKAHVIAHSMGNRALIGALGSLFEKADPRPPLSQIILVAADEDRPRFQKMVEKASEAYPLAADTTRPRFSVYCSEEDKALAISGTLHGWTHRLGDTRSHLQAGDMLWEHVDVIDTTGVSQGASSTCHSYHLRAPEVIKDIGILLEGGRRACERSGLHNDLKRRLYAFKEEHCLRSRTWCS